ncbi:MAG TPA: UDP-N-acetylmuramate:L-alanyl-gamma-D-glutamyl-meso-diaminopimelate ligase [Clostridia bacterium]|nr:UDP-N-acetylmuramate:L-alanyl-gamma-D-glutamyl-meso-diaminopimelate ligase [Clostridia bacterium]
MSGKRIHLVGICGTAMASLAGMLKKRGFHVQGSDNAAYPPMSDYLAELGIPVAQPFSPANLEPAPDLVVIGNAISRGNPEVEHVLNHRLPFTSMAQLIYDEFIRGHESLVVAGTHGKTTTTSMLAWIFEVAGRRPSFLVGGIAENFGASFSVAGGREFIIEGDEYDTAFWDKGPKFLHYFPDAVILTSVEFDHADIYRDLDAVKTSFKRLINLVPQRGRVIAWDGSPAVSECVAKAFCPVERYGFAADSFWRIGDIRYEPARTTWTVSRQGEPWAQFEFSLAGEYNVLNATAAAALASSYAIPVDAIAEALRTFRSVKRRLEVRAEVSGVTIIDDFAHHPTAIAQTLRALKTRYAGRRLWAVLEPRSNTLRRNVFQRELAASLAVADQVVVAGVFFKTTDSLAPEERLDLAAVIAGLQKEGKDARTLTDADAIVECIVSELREGDVVAILSNGGFGGIYEKLPAKLKALQKV